MFRVKNSDKEGTDSFLQRALQAALLLALLANFGSMVLMLSEYYRFRTPTRVHRDR